MKLTLGTDSNDRKNIPVFSGVLKYAPAALAGVARISKAGNDKHNPGQELYHARGKSNDHGDCVIRHAMDIADIVAHIERNYDNDPAVWYTSEDAKALLNEASQLAWRALIWSQELHEKFGGAPLAPGARLPSPATAPPVTAPPVIKNKFPVGTRVRHNYGGEATVTGKPFLGKEGVVYLPVQFDDPLFDGRSGWFESFFRKL